MKYWRGQLNILKRENNLLQGTDPIACLCEQEKMGLKPQNISSYIFIPTLKRRAIEFYCF